MQIKSFEIVFNILNNMSVSSEYYFTDIERVITMQNEI